MHQSSFAKRLSFVDVKKDSVCFSAHSSSAISLCLVSKPLLQFTYLATTLRFDSLPTDNFVQNAISLIFTFVNILCFFEISYSKAKWYFVQNIKLHTIFLLLNKVFSSIFKFQLHYPVLSNLYLILAG